MAESFLGLQLNMQWMWCSRLAGRPQARHILPVVHHSRCCCEAKGEAEARAGDVAEGDPGTLQPEPGLDETREMPRLTAFAPALTAGAPRRRTESPPYPPSWPRIELEKGRVAGGEPGESGQSAAPPTADTLRVMWLPVRRPAKTAAAGGCGWLPGRAIASQETASTGSGKWWCRTRYAARRAEA